MVQPIGRKVVERAYSSPARARAAVNLSSLGKAEKKRLLGLIDAWDSESNGSGPEAPAAELSPVIGAMPGPVVAPPSFGSSDLQPLRFETIRHAHGILSELARDKHVELVTLIDEIQAYELSIRREVQRREREGSLEEPS